MNPQPPLSFSMSYPSLLLILHPPSLLPSTHMSLYLYTHHYSSICTCLCLSISICIYLPTYLSITYLSIYFHLFILLPIYSSIYQIHLIYLFIPLCILSNIYLSNLHSPRKLMRVLSVLFHPPLRAQCVLV